MEEKLEEYKNYPFLLLREIGRTDNIGFIDKILDLQDNSKFTSERYKDGVVSILGKDENLFNHIFENYINIPNSYFSVKPIEDYTKYKGIIRYNFDILKLYDKANSIDSYYKWVEEIGGLRNLGLLLFYSFSYRTYDETLAIIDRYLVSDIINPKKANNKRYNQIRLYELISSVLSIDKNMSYNAKPCVIKEILRSPLIKTLSKSQIINLLKKLDSYYGCDEYNDLFEYVKDVITPSQFIDVIRNFNKKEISEYISILKNSNADTRFILKGIHNLSCNYDRFILYFTLMIENDIINSKNSAIVLNDLLQYTEFIYTSHDKNSFWNNSKSIIIIYELFITCGLDITEFEKYYNRHHNMFKTLSNNNSKTWVMYANQKYRIKLVLETLLFLKRKLVLNKLKMKLQSAV